MQKGLEKHKIIIGLPTYGHSYHLVNPFNPRLGAPAQDSGEVGMLGFATYSDVCWFQKYNLYVKTEYDAETCSPYLYTGTEWISYDNEASIECKTRYDEFWYGNLKFHSIFILDTSKKTILVAHLFSAWTRTTLTSHATKSQAVRQQIPKNSLYWEEFTQFYSRTRLTKRHSFGKVISDL